MMTRFSSAESRLLHLTTEDLKKMGVTDTTTVYNQRTAGANATVQNGIGGSDANAANNAQAYKDAQAQISASQNTYKNSSAGLQSSIKQSVQVNPDGSAQVVQSPVQAAASGQIDQSAITRLREAGYSEDQIRANMTDPARQESIQQTMSNTGLGGTARQSATLTPAQSLDQQADAYARSVVPTPNPYAPGAAEAKTAYETAIQNAKNTYYTKAQIQQTHDQQNYQKGQDQMAQGAASASGTNQSKNEQPKNNAPWLDAAIAGLPPEYQIIGQSLKETLDAQAAEKAAANANLGIETAAADASGKAYGELLNGMRADSDLFYKQAKSMAEDNQQRREESLAAEKKATLERISWEENKATRDARKALDKQVNKLVAGQAIGGGFGSSNWTKMVAEAEYEGETAILDLQKEFGFKRTDVDIAYTQTLDNIYSTAAQQKLDALKSHRSDIQQINQFRFTSTEKTEDRKAEAKKDYNKTLASIAKEQAASIKEATNTVVSTMNQVRDDNRAQEQLGWQRLEKAITTYGNNVPQSLLDSIGKMLPGVDVSDVSKAMTLAQMKKSKSGGASSGYIGFSNSQRGADGKAITLDQFIAQKQQDFNKSQNGPASTEQKKAWEKEYKAHAAEEALLSPDGIMRDWRIKQAQAGNFPSVAQMEATERNLSAAITSGNFQEARNIVDNIGSRPQEKSVAQITSIEKVINALDEMTTLVDRIENDIGPFPTEGKLWAFINENIETSPDYQRMKQLRDSNLSPYSRGVSGERGATTEGDVQRVLSSLIDENVSPDALRAGLEQAKKQAHMSVNLYLRGLRDGGFRVNDLQNTYDSGSWKTTDTGLSQEQSDWLASQ